MAPSEPLFKRVAVIGLGLIGGSLACAIRRNGLAGTVVGTDQRDEELQLGKELGVIDQSAASIADAVRGADLVVLAVPVRATRKVLEQVRPALEPDAVLTDVGNTKSSFVTDVEAVFGGLSPYVIPGHPIAGSEKSGIRAANPELFANHKVILTPPDDVSQPHLARLKALWEGCGATVLTMSVAYHDEVLAATSHLPHLIAFSLVDTLAGEDENMDIFRYAAGGFRDFTRIAASDPVMWHDIFLSNRDAVLRVIDHFTHDLEQLRTAIANQDSATLLRVFSRAKAAREHFSKMLSGQAYVTNNSEKQVTFRLQPGGAITGDIRVPGDKSMSHRSIMLGALADGVTEVKGFLEGEDSLATLQAFRDMGVTIEGPDDGFVRIHGVGMHGLQAPRGPLYLGNSGTAMRLFAGLLAAQPFDSELTGDASLSGRPMGRVADPLRAMGAVIDTAEGGRPPLKIRGGQKLSGIHYEMPVASAQVKSCLLLAGLYAEGSTSVTEPAPTRDHTERMLAGFGYHVHRDGATASVSGGGKLTATNIDVPADISSSAFFLVAASIAPGSDLILPLVGRLYVPAEVGTINFYVAGQSASITGKLYRFADLMQENKSRLVIDCKIAGQLQGTVALGTVYEDRDCSQDVPHLQLATVEDGARCDAVLLAAALALIHLTGFQVVGFIATALGADRPAIGFGPTDFAERFPRCFVRHTHDLDERERLGGGGEEEVLSHNS